MELQISLIFISLLSLLAIVKLVRWKTHNLNSNLPPGPRKLPLIGHLHHLVGLPHHSLRDLAMKHGPLIFLQIGEIPALIVSSPRMAEQVMKTHDLVFADRPVLLAAKIMTYNCVGVLFSPYGGHWRQLRKICALELLSSKRVKSFWSQREEEVASLIHTITISSHAGSPINISEKLCSLSYDITSKAAFGQKCKQAETFIRLMHQVTEMAGGFDVADVFPSLTFLHPITGLKTKIEKIHHEIDIILESIIDEHRINTRRKNNLVYEDLVDVLVRLEEDNQLEYPITNNIIKAVILEIFTAGSETASTTIEWVFSELLRCPRVLEKTQAEVRRVLSGKEKIQQSDIDGLNYLRSVIWETLRLHPPAPLLPPRESRQACVIDGYEIPKGTKLIVNAWALGRDPDYWEEAEIFKPERFEHLPVDYKGKNFEYIPFGAGRRICPGMSFGVATMELQLAQLLYHFDWKLPGSAIPEELDMMELFGATVGRKSNLYLIPTRYMPV